MSDRHVSLPGALGGDDRLEDWREVDAYVAELEDASGLPEVIAEWLAARSTGKSDPK